MMGVMSVPYYKDKSYHKEITGPEFWASHMKEKGAYADFIPPERFIFTWQRSFFQGIKSRYAHKTCKGFIGEVIILDEDEASRPTLGVAGNFGIGAPAAVLLMESLIALGVKQFVGLGTAGGLMSLDELKLTEEKRSLRIGSTILAVEALRDEGTSYHYLPEDQRAKPDSEQFEDLTHLMNRAGLPYKTSSVWTTDAFFRETAEEVEFYLERGVQAVDMEASALFACAEKRGVSMVSLFVISDILTSHGWAPDFKHGNIKKTLDDLFELLRTSGAD
jgi:uridine phosphorylase